MLRRGRRGGRGGPSPSDCRAVPDAEEEGLQRLRQPGARRGGLTGTEPPAGGQVPARQRGAGRALPALWGEPHSRPSRPPQALHKKHRECESPEVDEVFALTPQTEEKYKKIDEEFDKMMQSYRLAVSSGMEDAPCGAWCGFALGCLGPDGGVC